MTTTTTTTTMPGPTTIPLRSTPPTRKRRQALITVLFAFLPAVVLPLGWYVDTGAVGERTALGLLIVAGVLVVSWGVWLFALGRPEPIVVDDELLIFSFGRRRLHVRLEELFSARIVKGSLVLIAAVPFGFEPRGDTGIFVIPKRCFAAGLDATSVLTAVRDRLSARTDGAERLAIHDGVATAQQQFAKKRPLVTMLVSAACIGVFAAELNGGALFELLISTGANVSTDVVDGEVWRLVTANLLHGSMIHLAMNLISLLGTGPLLERWLGRWSMVLILVVTGIGGQLASTLVGLAKATPHASVGISGAIFGLIGILLVSTVRFWRHPIGGVRVPLEGWAIIVVANAAISIIPVVDVTAHVGGAIAGVVVGIFVVPSPRKAGKRPVRAIRNAGVVALVVAVVAVTRWVIVLAGA